MKRAFTKRQIKRHKELFELRMRPIRAWRHWLKQIRAKEFWDKIPDVEAELRKGRD